VPSLGWSSSMNSQKGFWKGKATTAGLPSAPESVQTSPTVRGQTTLFPDLTKFKRTSPCLQRDRDHGLRWGLPATGYTFGKAWQQSRRIPEWLFDWQVWPSASNPHPSLIASSHSKSKELD
jgi:hypothetical protein